MVVDDVVAAAGDSDVTAKSTTLLTFAQKNVCAPLTWSHGGINHMVVMVFVKNIHLLTTKQACRLSGGQTSRADSVPTPYTAPFDC
jgi:hypothetical protein